MSRVWFDPDPECVLQMVGVAAGFRILIAVTEDHAILESKMGDAKWAEGRAKQQLDALQAYATQTRTEHYELKTQLKEQLKQSKVMAPPPAPAPAPSVTVKDQLMAEHEKTV